MYIFRYKLISYTCALVKVIGMEDEPTNPKCKMR